jgi:NAD(P)-dependent dehydrogenase (short-subunit alcohol dehydrogenase family)
MDGFNGRKIVIAGGTNGIGFATARELARRRANILLADIDKSALE